MVAAIAIENSENKKLGNCSATYASQQTCPKSCPYYNNGCYAELGLVGMVTRRLNKAEKQPLIEIAREEAAAIDNLSGKRPLRLHVVGDSTTKKGTKLLAVAAKNYSKKFGSKVWSYTHAWRKVSRGCWGDISILASCESVKDVARALKHQYAAALVVSEFKQNTAYDIGNGFKLIPCPNQTKGVTCDQCKLCHNDKRLLDNKLVIGFAAHGSKRESVKRSLL